MNHTRQHLGDTVSTDVEVPDIDANQPIEPDKFGLRIDGDGQMIVKISR